MQLQGGSGARGGVGGAREDGHADGRQSDDRLHGVGDPGGLRRLLFQETHRAGGE